MRLQNRTATVTGAGSGTGRAAARLFAQEGAQVVVADLDAAAGARTRSEIEAGGGEAIAVVVDVTRATDVRRMVEEAIKRFGRVDVLYNHVGIHRPGPVAELDEADWDVVLATNLNPDRQISGVVIGPRHATGGARSPADLERGRALLHLPQPAVYSRRAGVSSRRTSRPQGLARDAGRRIDVLAQKPAERTPAVTYTEMDKGTREEYVLLSQLAQTFKSHLADRVLAHMQLLHDSYPGERVDRYVHSLQTATRAHRHGADEETVVAGLLHDIGDMLAPENHGELAAAVLRPYVSSAIHWVVAKHGIFQGYYYFHHFGMNRDQREEFRGHPAYEKAIRFSEWDQASFDPSYETLPIDAFEPMVRRIFAREPWGSHSSI